MFTEAGTAGSDDWWALRLATKLGAGFPRMKLLQSYRDGTALIPAVASGQQSQAYLNFVRTSRLNMADLIVSARTNRIKPVGFKTAAPNDDTGDTLAWSLWKRTGMKVTSKDVFSDAMHFGCSYLTVTGPRSPSADAAPAVMASNEWRTIGEPSVTQPWLLDAALTVGYDPVNGEDQLVLFRPGYFRVAYRPARVSSIPTDGTMWAPGSGWSWSTDPIPLGFTADMPVVRIANKDGVGVYEQHLDSLNRINQTILQRSTIIAYQAFRQLAILGDLPEFYPADHPRAGEKINYSQLFKSGPGEMWTLGEGSKVWESSVTDISPVTNAIKDDVKNLASVTHTPAYVLSSDSANQSAEGAALQREGLVFAVEDFIDRADLALAQVMSLEFQAIGDTTRANVNELVPMWAPVDRASIAERAQAAQAAKVAGLSQRTIDEKIFQLSPEEMAQELQNLQDSAFLTPVA